MAAINKPPRRAATAQKRGIMPKSNPFQSTANASSAKLPPVTAEWLLSLPQYSGATQAQAKAEAARYHALPTAGLKAGQRKRYMDSASAIAQRAADTRKAKATPKATPKRKASKAKAKS